MHRVFVSVGSNIEPEKNVLSACNTLGTLLSESVVSPVYESPAVGMNGADFLNCVVGGSTSLTIRDLHSALRGIEDANGRVRDKGSFSNRTLDLDLLLYDQRQISSETLTLPRPEVYTSAFVLQPLADVAARSLDPLSGRTWQSLLTEAQELDPDKFKVLSVYEIDL